MAIRDFLLFASDAEIAGLWGLALLGAALIALLAERRRTTRARIDRVGWVPWTGVFLVCAISGTALLALAAKGLLGGG